MKAFPAILIAMTAFAFPAAVAAQAGAARLPVVAVSSPFAPAPRAEPSIFLAGRTSYWAEGGGIGAVLLGIAGAAFGASGCSDGDSGASSGCVGPVVGLALLGAGVGFTVGSLVGARIPRE